MILQLLMQWVARPFGWCFDVNRGKWFRCSEKRGVK